MKNHFLSRFDAENLWETMIYLIIAGLIIIISLLIGLDKSVFMFWIGSGIFFFAALHPWERSLYYLILVVISLILLILLFKVGIGILVKIESKYQIPGRWAENMGWNIGGSFLAGIIAGIIGAFRFKKYD